MTKLVADNEKEFLEEYSEEGKGTGKRIKRGVAHKEGLWHAVAHCWITDRRGNLLLQKRSLKKMAFPGCYDVSAAGHVPYGDKPVDAGVNEIYEELGLKFNEKELDLIGVFNQTMILNQGTYVNKEIVFCYHVELEEINFEEITMQACELDGVGVVFWSVFRDMLKGKDERVVDVNTDTEYLKQVWKSFSEKYKNNSPTSKDFIRTKNRV